MLRWREGKGDFAKPQPQRGGGEERHGGLAVLCGLKSSEVVKVTIETMVRFGANATSRRCDEKKGVSKRIRKVRHVRQPRQRLAVLWV